MEKVDVMEKTEKVEKKQEKNPRTAYGLAILELARADRNVVALDADLCTSTQSAQVEKNLPAQYFEMGIGEANMASVAAGFALCGKTPFIHTFAVFATGRPFDQIRQGICLPNLNVKIVGSSEGLSDFGDGATHQCFEDMALMSVLPNMTVLAPVDAAEVPKVVRAAAAIQGPVYIRLNRNDLPLLTDESTPFEIGKPLVLAEGKDVAICVNGVTAGMGLAAREILSGQGLEARVVNFSTIKPLNEKIVREALGGVRALVTAEEHSVIGGLGAAIAGCLSKAPLPTARVGIADRYGQSSHSYEQLLEHYGLTPEAIAGAAREILKA
ncbi:MAG: transketolase family protein [Synergistaceae bacterium]|jgi:transketolase|nr:transketolase family protein [Synergistaceae bacterium]